MADLPGEARLVELEDGGVLNVVELGSQKGYPLMLLHGGPGLDHHEFRPWLDPLADMGFRLLYVDERGQGDSPRVDPASLMRTWFDYWARTEPATVERRRGDRRRNGDQPFSRR